MGLLYEKKCGNCKYLSEAISCGICKVTNHKVIKVEDDEFAENCDLYENKYGYVDNIK